MDANSIIEGLNSDQRAAVLHDHSKNAQLLILAGAGSGKTSVLTKRIQYRIAMGVAPEKILALTFTAKAATEMRERVQKLFPDAGVRLCTFHSLALYMLKCSINGKPAYEMLGFKKAPAPKESADRVFMGELVRLKIKPGTLTRENLFDPDLPVGLKQKIKPLKEGVLASGQVVFEDLIYEAIYLLENFDEARQYFMNQWSEILVDEYQDINPTQYRLVKNLLANRKSLFVVGDDDQAIYGFRGADIGNINRFCEDFKESTLIRLEWNYRSVPNILHFANEIFKNKPLRLQKVLRAGNSRGSDLFCENRVPEIWESENPVEEMQKIVGCIKQMRMDYGLQWKNFAILVRYNRQRLYYEEALQDEYMPLYSEENEDGVHVETVHASKGLQYAVVFYVGMAEKLTPGECLGNKKQRKNQLEEERRLFYVGVTRAESFLVLLYCRRRFWKGRLVKFRRSRFLPKPQKRKDPKVPLLFFKVYILALVLGYMAFHMAIFPFIILFKGKETKLWLDKKIQLFSKFCMKHLGVNLDIVNQANLAKVDWSRPVFVLCNHGSYADIPIAFLTLERTVGFIAKKELKYVPFLHFWMEKLGCVFVDRQKGGGGKLIREMMGKMDTVPCLSIFPEGTRSKTGKLLPFKSGGFRLALEAEAFIIPIVIKNSASVWERRKNTGPQSVTATILQPIDTALEKKNRVLDDVKSELVARVYKDMEALL
ncbi:MAG: UvrD-helicase domain-containing protein [Fibrobacteraceae bacterium]|nr:UvrD-helicase domain-containing protein [Fibrobacteraceae bacterium]